MPKNNLKSNIVFISEKRADDKFRQSTENAELNDDLERMSAAIDSIEESLRKWKEEKRLYEIEMYKLALRQAAFLRKQLYNKE